MNLNTDPWRTDDAQNVSGLSHPARIALPEVRALEGIVTATEADPRVDGSATTCSSHSRQLSVTGSSKRPTWEAFPERFRERLTDHSARPGAALPVEIPVLSYPAAPPPKED